MEQSSQSALQVVGKIRVPNEFCSQQNPGFLHHKIADDSGKPWSFVVLVIGIANRLQQAYKSLECYLIVRETVMDGITLTYFRRTGWYRHLTAMGATFLRSSRGRIYLILGNQMVNLAANEIFQEYQDQAVSGALQFRRWPLRSVGAVTNSIASGLT